MLNNMKKLILKYVLPVILILSLVAISSPKTHADSIMGWKDIAVGGTLSLGIKNDGTVWAWGEDNFYGYFGNGESGFDTTNPEIPVQVKGLSDVISIAAGEFHALAIKSDGTVWSWGDISPDEIDEGSGIVINTSLPGRVKDLTHIVGAGGKYFGSFAIKDDGTLWSWGGPYTINPDNSVVHHDTPEKLNFQNVAAISIGISDNLLVLEKDGSVWATDKTTNMNVQIIGLSEITAIAAGGTESYALGKDGIVWRFGSEIKDGIIPKTPEMVMGIQDVASIQASAYGLLYLKKDGTVWSSGKNFAGQLGNGSYESSDIPVQIKNLTKIKKIVANGLGHRSMALREDGTLWSWGNGPVGDGTQWNRLEPVWIRSNYAEPIPPSNLITVDLDGVALEFEQQPTIINGRTMVPLRKIFESLGAELKWDGSTSTITATKGQTVIILSVGKQTGTVNGGSISVDSPPININGSTLVPVRFIGESLGIKVIWDPTTFTVHLITK